MQAVFNPSFPHYLHDVIQIRCLGPIRQSNPDDHCNIADMPQVLSRVSFILLQLLRITQFPGKLLYFAEPNLIVILKLICPAEAPDNLLRILQTHGCRQHIPMGYVLFI
ncbi:hypothetical protein D3C75_930580 [compost metagenome]